MECSGQGDCDRTTGSCVCYDGYEGVACQRMSCPNLCSGHGICDAVYLMGLDQSLVDSYYIHNTQDNELKYSLWDKQNSYACVCDSEWTGYDCSQRKCPTGYVTSSDCDTPSQSIQTITLTITNEKKYGYLYYTDYFNRKYSTDLIDLTSEEQWKKALYTLPTGSIDISSISVKTLPDQPSPPNTQTTTITIEFGKHQTGRQPQLQVIGEKELATYPFSLGSESKSGYKGMTKDINEDKKLFEGGDDKIVYSNSGLPPVTCSGNGLCNPTTGLCDCFLGFYGLACTEQAALI